MVPVMMGEHFHEVHIEDWKQKGFKCCLIKKQIEHFHNYSLIYIYKINTIVNVHVLHGYKLVSINNQKKVQM